MEWKQGFHPGLSFGDYKEIDAVNASSLKTMMVSAKAYKAQLDAPDKEATAAMTLGSAVHTATLEPHKFSREYAVFTGERRAGAAWTAFAAENADKVILKADERDTALAMAEAVRSDPVAGTIMAEQCAAEVSVLWEHPELGVRCKARIDLLTASLIADLKTTRKIEPREFAKDAAAMGYHVQMAFYQDAVKAVTGRTMPFRIVAVENAAPFDVVVYSVPEEVIEAGRYEYLRLLQLRELCLARGEWPGVAGGKIVSLPFPAWAMHPQEDDGEGFSLNVGGQSIKVA